MAQTLNKSALKQQREQLQLYQQYLPSLDLKRQQLLQELNKARQQQHQLQQQRQQLWQEHGSWLGLLAQPKGEALRGVVQLRHVVIETENRLGVKLPLLEEVTVDGPAPARVTTPHWQEEAVELARELLHLELALQVQAQRVQLLTAALQTVTQRVNLFDQVLIPQAQDHIRRIQIYLGDTQRAAVVRAKLAKQKRQGRS